MTEHAASSHATLLLVDDEASILSSLRRLFRPHNYRILLAESGAAGLELLEKEAVDLVISDMRMPEMDGAQFLEKVRARWPGTSRILLTGYADITSTINAINKGEIYRYITKPWDDNDIVMVVREALEHKRLKAENERLLALTQAQNQELKSLNAGLEERVMQRTAELLEANSSLKTANGRLKQNFLVSIKMFSGLMELREGSVGGHSRRVADLARKLAIALEADAKTQQDVFVAGLLHDIGKIGFSDAMLGKSVAAMTSEELGRYRKHPLSGTDALLPLPELRDAAALIRSHHERFDGTGFPDRIVGIGIPLGARILAVANDYDGLQIGTTFENKMTVDAALRYISESRGKRYCPTVVDALKKIMGGVDEDVVREISVTADKLMPGMVLAKDIVTRDGILLLAADFVLDEMLVRELRKFFNYEAPGATILIRADQCGR
jgi:response regulator RpfG family c-di-GMP phosphodiesterase